MSIPMPDAPRLGSGAPLGETLVRMLGDLLQRARVELAENPDHDLAVHEARKAMKRARALLRLARGAIGKKGFAAEDAVIRDAGRLLAPLRDARVTLDAIHAIASGSCPRLAERLEARHRSLIEEAWADDVIVGRLASDLEGIEARLTELIAGNPDLGYAAIRAGLVRSYRRGRKRLRHAHQAPSGEAFHEWRKEVKHLRYQLEALDPADADGLGVLVRSLDELGETLGLEHDLVVLGDLVVDEEACGKESITLLAALEARGAELRSRALALGDLWYSGKPGVFADRIDLLVSF